jgi:hypothetical protein
MGFYQGSQGIKYHKTGIVITHVEEIIIKTSDFFEILKPKNAATKAKIVVPIIVPRIDSVLKPVGSVIKAYIKNPNQGTIKTEKHIRPEIIPHF